VEKFFKRNKGEAKEANVLRSCGGDDCLQGEGGYAIEETARVHERAGILERIKKLGH